MNIEYSQEGDEPIINFFRREGGIRKHYKIKGFRPYFYVDECMHVPKDPRIMKVESGYQNILKEPVKKVVCRFPQDVGMIRNLFSKTYEADIQFTKRWVIDNEPDFGEEFSILFIDIECWDKNGFPDPEKAKEQVLAISAFDSIKQCYWTLCLDKEYKVEKRIRKGIIDGKEYPWQIKHFVNEKDMLKALIDLIKYTDPDILSGWNSYRFDWEYLINRMKILGIDYRDLSPIRKVKEGYYRAGLLNPREKYREPMDIGGRLFFDCLMAYKRIQRKGIESYSLEYVSQKELGVGKISGGKRIHEMTLEEIITYNCMDVELTKEIEVKRKVISYFWGMANFIKCYMTETQSFSRMGDTFMLRKKGNMIFPTVQVSKSDTFEGGRVFDPPKGRFDNVVVFDLTSLYPSIIMSLNISIDTVVPKEEADIHIDDLDVYITDKKKGFIPKVMEDLFNERDKYRKILESGIYKRGTDDWLLAWNKSEYVKQLANSVYGMFAYKGFRLYVPKLSESTTYVGRKTLDWTKKIAQENGYNVIYGDTDSVFITGWKNGTPEQIMEESEKLRDKINKSYDEFVEQFGIKKHKLSIKSEELFDNVTFIGVKKRYFGKMVYKRGEKVDLLEIIGFETKRSDTSIFTRNFQKIFMNMVCDRTENKKLLEFVYNKMKEIRNSDIMSIALPKAIVMDISKYKVKTNVIKAAEYANKYLGKKYDSGDKPRFIYIKDVKKGLPKTHEDGKKVDGICFDNPKDIEGFSIDYDRMVNLLICKKVNNILIALECPEVIPDSQQSNLMSWFE